MRAQARNVVRLLLAALLLQFAGPVPRLVGHLFHDQSSAGRVVICSEGGVHYIPSDGAPAKAPTDGGNGTGGDCCSPACHIHGALLASPLTVTRSSIWGHQRLVGETAALPDSTPGSSFEARAPPRSV
jgi:hypothetical protein